LLILLAAFVLRLTYAHNLPLNQDEMDHLELAKTISLSPDHLNLPLGNQVTNHPILSTYIIAFGNWLGKGSIFTIRAIFIIISLWGMIGLFTLAQNFFGYRTAVIALLLASFDHHLITYAPVFLEPVYLCLVPWVILSIYKIVTLDNSRHWLLIGIFFGLGYQCSEIFLLLLMGMSFYIISSRKTGRVLQSGNFYLSVLIFLLLVSPHIIWNINNQAVNIIRHVERVSSWGLVPRVMLLYIGDLLICLKDSSWIVMGLTNKIYSPWFIPCHWFSGLAYLSALGYSLRFFRNNHYAVLHLFIWPVFLLVSFMNANEPWNESGWASMTVFPVIVLAASVMNKIYDIPRGRILMGIFSIIVIFFAVLFLRGPKFCYASPCWEKNFLGKVLYYKSQRDAQMSETLINKTLIKHPDSAIVWYFKADVSKNAEEKVACFTKVLELDHFNPLVSKKLAKDLIRTGNNKKASTLLQHSLNKGNDFVSIRKLLCQAEYNLKNYSAAEAHINQALRMKPDGFDLYKSLYYIKIKQGKETEALKALDRYVMSTAEPHNVYLSLSEACLKEGNPRRAAILRKRALAINPEMALPVPAQQK